MPSYSINVILQSDTTATGNTDFRNGTWDLTGGYSTITYSDDDTLGLGDDDPAIETGSNAIITSVNGDTSHPLVGSDIVAKYVRSDDNDGDTDNDPDVVLLGTSGGFDNFAMAAFPGTGWSMSTGDTFISGGTTTTHSGGGSWSQEGLLDGTVLNPPCFTAGMEIRTQRGAIATQDLVVGDMVWTLDNGYQELKFINRQKVPALGSLTPVLFKKGAIGNSKDLIVSQKHRFHVGSLPNHLSERFGEYKDTLLQALFFCDGVNVRLYPEIKTVEYFHLMFDDHQLLECYGTYSESWQPTRNALKQNPDQAEELLAIFPHIAKRKASDPGALVRHEIQLRKPAHV
ncbi:MAG: Hint domain-containing protein [Planktomarina sp.]